MPSPEPSPNPILLEEAEKIITNILREQKQKKKTK